MRRAAGTPAARFAAPESPAEDFTIVVAPLAEAPPEPAAFSLGPPDARTVVDVTVDNAPPGGLTLCLPAAPGLAAAAAAAGATPAPLHYGDGEWTALPDASWDAGTSLACGAAAEFSPFAVGFPVLPSASFAAAASSAAEDAGTVEVKILFSPPPESDLTLRYVLGGTATRGGTGAGDGAGGGGADYRVAGAGALAVAAGSAEAAVAVAVRDDARHEPAETVTLTLSPGDGYGAGAVRVHTLTITDDDPFAAAASREHLFPLFADGGGFRTRLYLTNAAGAGNRCELTLHGAGLNAARFEAHPALTVSGAGAGIVLGAGGETAVLATAGAGSYPALGYAKLVCGDPAVARMLLTLESGGEPAALANLESARPARVFQFPVLPRLDRLALVLANDGAADAACAVETAAGGGDIAAPAGSAAVRFLDELVPAAEGGAARVTCDRPVAALAVPLHGGDFAALAPAVLEAAGPADAESRRILPLALDGGGFRSSLIVTSLSEGAKRLRAELPFSPACPRRASATRRARPGPIPARRRWSSAAPGTRSR